MKIYRIYFLATFIAVTSFASSAIQAAPPAIGDVYRYIGTTTATTPSTIGLNGMNDMCRVAFGDTARMCSTKEFFQTPDTSHAPSGDSYLRPVQIAAFHDPDAAQGFRNISYEWTGYRFTGHWPRVATCFAWRHEEPEFSSAILNINESGRAVVTTSNCSEVYPVTCCQPQ